MPKPRVLKLSPLSHTWILDLDGTVLKHNGYKLDGIDTLLPGALDFLLAIPKGDMVIFLTSRPACYATQTEEFLTGHGISYSQIIYGAPYGERILINDDKPTGLKSALAVRKKRNSPFFPVIQVDPTL